MIFLIGLLPGFRTHSIPALAPIEIGASGLKNFNNKDFQFWQQDSHPIELWSDEVFYQKLNYIHMNPVVSGFVSEPEHWLYNSARNYGGLPGFVPITSENGSKKE